MKKVFMALALLALAAYATSSQAFLGPYGSCGTCIGRVYDRSASICDFRISCPSC